MTVDGSCNPDRIFRLAFGEPTDDERAGALEHLASCESCRNELAAMQRIAGGRDWRDTSAPAKPPSDEALANVRRIAELDAASHHRAEADLQTILALPAANRIRSVFQHSIELTPALAWRVMEAADTLLFTDPRRALPLYDLATYVADTAVARGAAHAHELRVETWKNYAWALSFMGEYAQAEEALWWAEDAANQCADRRHLTAVVHFSTGILLSQMERWSEALAVVATARKVFEEVADETRRVKALEQEANIHLRTGNATKAVVILSAIVPLP